MSFRTAIPDFQLANPLYVGALIRFYTVDVNGDKTTTLAPLYASPIGGVTVSNPQLLDGEGKFPTPVYHDVPIVAELSGAGAASLTTGIIMPASSWGDDWTSGRLLIVNTFVRNPADLSIYIATNTYNTAGSIATDIAAGNLELVFQGQAAAAAAASAAAAAASAVEAAAALGQLQSQRRVAIAYQSAPPGGPTTGQSYVVKTAGTGAWAGQNEKIATWNGASWVFETATEGWEVYLTGIDVAYSYSGSSWGEILPTDGSLALSKLAPITTQRILGRNEGADGPVELLTGAEVAVMIGGWKPLVRVKPGPAGLANQDYAIPAGVRALRIMGLVKLAINGQLYLRLSNNNAVSYKSSAADYFINYIFQSQTTISGQSATPITGITLTDFSDQSNLVLMPINTTVALGDAVQGTTASTTTLGLRTATGGINLVASYYTAFTGVITHIRFIASASNILEGTDFLVEYL